MEKCKRTGVDVAESVQLRQHDLMGNHLAESKDNVDSLRERRTMHPSSLYES